MDTTQELIERAKQDLSIMDTNVERASNTDNELDVTIYYGDQAICAGIGAVSGLLLALIGEVQGLRRDLKEK